MEKVFDIFKFRKLNKLLEDANVTGNTKKRLDMEAIEKGHLLFSSVSDKSRSNFDKLLQMLYESMPSANRIRLLILIHIEVRRDAFLADIFLTHKRKEYKGVKIVKKQRDKSPLKQQSQHNSKSIEVSPQVSQTKRYSIDQEILYDNVDVYLFIYMVQPYVNYLMKLAANIEVYEECQRQKEVLKPNMALVWKLVNLIKCIVPIRSVLTHIGRYYLAENRYIIDFLQVITRDIFYFYRVIQQNVCVTLTIFVELDRDQMENAIAIVQQLAQLNEALFEIFYGRYYYKMLQHVRSPSWVSVSNEQLDAMYRAYQLRYGKLERHMQENRKPEHCSLTMSNNKRAKTKNFEQLDMSFGNH